MEVCHSFKCTDCARPRDGEPIGCISAISATCRSALSITGTRRLHERSPFVSFLHTTISAILPMPHPQPVHFLMRASYPQYKYRRLGGAGVCLLIHLEANGFYPCMCRATFPREYYVLIARHPPDSQRILTLAMADWTGHTSDKWVTGNGQSCLSVLTFVPP